MYVGVLACEFGGNLHAIRYLSPREKITPYTSNCLPKNSMTGALSECARK